MCALTFGALTSDRVDCGSGANLDDLTAFTFLAWVYPTTLTSLRYFGIKGSIATGKQFRLNGTTGNIQIHVDRATSDSRYITNDTPLATLNKWYLVAFTYDEAASPSGHIYVGDLATIAVESTYGTAEEGSGATASDASGEMRLGNGGTTVAFQGRIANAAYINGALSLAAIRSWQFAPRILPDTRGYWILGYNGVSTQADLSGNGNAGTVIGATVSDHVPLRAPFGFDSGALALAVAAGGGAQTVNANAIASTEAVYQPTVTSVVTVSANLIAGAEAHYQPTITVGAVIVSPNLITSAAQVFEPTITTLTTIAPNLVASTAVVYQPTVTTGAVTVVLERIESTATIYEPSITIGQTVALNRIDSAEQVFAPTVTTGAVTIAPNFIASAEIVYQPTVQIVSVQTVNPNRIESTAVVYQVIVALYTASVERTFTVARETRTFEVVAELRTYEVA